MQFRATGLTISKCLTLKQTTRLLLNGGGLTVSVLSTESTKSNRRDFFILCCVDPMRSECVRKLRTEYSLKIL